MDQSKIRNFAIIAHVDHGKSTLADRLLEMTGTVNKRDLVEQTLDSHPVSRERGITIRLSPVTMHYELRATSYELNLIDTPGHVDFSYEVERSLAACEGVILLVDATQGVQAQTLSHLQKAKKLNLKIIPIVNKIDSLNANIEETKKELEELTGEKAFLISAKTGQGVGGLLKVIIEKIPAPDGNPDAPTKTRYFSSQYSQERGVVAFVKVIDGTLSGEVGYLITNTKDPAKIALWDGYNPPNPIVFVSFFPVDQDGFNLLEDALKKLKLNDAAITFTPTSSKALGRGFRCGFLGHLHAEVSQERLETDFNLSIIATSPTVEYKDNLEPWVKATIIVPKDYIGAIISLCEDRRGVLANIDYHENKVTLFYQLPLAEIITDFFDQLKSKSSGYASFDYEVTDYRPFDSVSLDIIINHESVDAFSQIMEKSKAEKFGKVLVEKLAEIIPRQQIPIPIQAAIDGQIIARADIKAYRKDVTAKLYGGDFTRRLKLLEKQKRGKEKMQTLSRSSGKMVGKVEIPNDTFLKVFQT